LQPPARSGAVLEQLVGSAGGVAGLRRREQVQPVGDHQVQSAVEVVIQADYAVAVANLVGDGHAGDAAGAAGPRHDREGAPAVVLKQHVRQVLGTPGADQKHVEVHVVVEVAGDAAGTAQPGGDAARRGGVHDTLGGIGQQGGHAGTLVAAVEATGREVAHRRVAGDGEVGIEEVAARIDVEPPGAGTRV